MKKTRETWTVELEDDVLQMVKSHFGIDDLDTLPRGTKTRIINEAVRHHLDKAALSLALKRLAALQAEIAALKNKGEGTRSKAG